MPDLEPVNGDPFAERFTGEPGKLPVEGPYFDPTKMPDWWARNVNPQIMKWPGEGPDLNYGWPNPDPVLPPMNYKIPYDPESRHERGKYTPVGSFELHPVGGDPFASMTHQPEQPVQPYMHPNVPAAANAIAGFASGGLQGAGVPLPDWAASNPLQRALQNPDNQTSLGINRIPLKGEVIASAATKIGDKIYSGATHGHAFSQAEDELKLSGKVSSSEWKRLLNNLQEGFLTSTGRFVNREEANAIASNAAQIDKQSSHYTPSSLASESVRLEPVSHDPFAKE